MVQQLDLEDASVLLVEDDPDLVHAYRERLEERGCIVAVAATGTEALARATRVQPDVIFLDLMLRSGDGRQFLDRLRADTATAQLPVVIIKRPRAGVPPAGGSSEVC